MELSVYLGRDPQTGKVRQRFATVKGTKEAEATLAAMIHAGETGMDFDATRQRVSDYLDQWLAVMGKSIRPRTARRYEELLRLHVISVLGNIVLAKLNPLHLEAVYAEARAKGLSEQTLLHIHRVVFTALRQAMKWQLVARNVAEAVVAPTPGRRKLKPLSLADALHLLASPRATDLEIPTVLGIGTGMPLGEACAGQTLQIDKTWGTPKTHRSERRSHSRHSWSMLCGPPQVAKRATPTMRSGVAQPRPRH